MNTTTMAMSTTVAPPTTPSPPIVSVPDSPAIEGSQPLVELSFVCNHQFDEGERAGKCLAVFSVDNPSGDVVSVEVGANNYVSPGALNLGQPTSFAAGTRYGGASFEWDCTTHMHARWTLRTGGGTTTATAPRAHKDCPKVPGT